MGITSNCSKFLAYTVSKGVSFRETLMLGRQHLYAPRDVIEQHLARFKAGKNSDAVEFRNEFAEPLFQLLGATTIESLDVSSFEGAAKIHDLNLPVPLDWQGRYSAIFDGGTLEHIFNFPVAIANCIRMLKVGGHFISITPANNQCGHGFYQFSPELYFSLFRKEHGLDIVQLILAVDREDGDRDWFEVASPAEVRERVTFSTHRPAYLMVVGLKLTDVADPLANMHQSDYAAAWEEVSQAGITPIPVWREVLRATVPRWVRDRLYPVLNKRSGTRSVEGLGTGNPRHFKRLYL